MRLTFVRGTWKSNASGASIMLFVWKWRFQNVPAEGKPIKDDAMMVEL